MGPGQAGAERAAPVIPAANDAMEARAMSPQWMAKVAEMLATWYRDQVSWQVRIRLSGHESCGLWCLQHVVE